MFLLLTGFPQSAYPVASQGLALWHIVPAAPSFRPGDPLLAWCLPIVTAGTAPASAASSHGAVVLATSGTSNTSGASTPVYTERDRASKARLRDSTGAFVASSPAGVPVFATVAGTGTSSAGTAAPVGTVAVIIPLPFECAPGAYRLEFLDAAGSILASTEIKVEARTFLKEDIPLDAANTELRRKPDPRKDAEWLEIAAIYARFDPGSVYMQGRFGLPAGPARRTAFFGDRRIYRYADGSQDKSTHAGIDFAMPVGTTVRAPAAGRIVFAKSRIVTGLTMVVEHLPGLYSVYMHLSEFLLRPGDSVARGTVIATSGNTGLSTGPHLHWEIRALGEAVDPDFFTAVSVTLP